VSDAYRLGAVDYLTKPLVPAILRSKVSVFVNLFQNRQEIQRQEEQLRRAAEHKTAVILESLTDGFIALDRQWRFTYANAAAERIANLSRAQMLGKNIWQLFPATAGTPLEQEYRRAVADNVPVEFEHYDEPWKRWIEVRAYPATDGGLAVYFRDMSARRREEERRTLFAEAGRILGSSLDYEVTLGSVCELVVPAFAEWCALDVLGALDKVERLAAAGHEPALATISQELRRRYPPRANDERGLMKVLKSGAPEFHPEITDELLTLGARDAEHLEILRSLGLKSAIIVPLTARGRTFGALTLVTTAASSRQFAEDDLHFAVELGSRVALAIDNARLFSDAQQAAVRREEALSLHRSVEQQLMLLVEASGSLSATLDVSSVLTAILDLSRRLVTADAYAIWRCDTIPAQWRIGLASGLSEEYQHSIIRVLQDTPDMPDRPIVAEDVLRAPVLGDREKAYEREGICSLLAVPLKVRGRLNGTLVFYYRSPHRFSEVEVRVATALSNLAASAISTAELYEEIKTSDRRKDEFLAMLSHELRGPLAAVNNAVTVLKLSRDAENRDWASDVVERQVKQLARLIADLLDVSRITSGTIQLRNEFLDATSIIDHAVETARPIIDERKHELLVSVDRDRLPLLADPTRFEQILVNLLTNAAKYTNIGGRIWLTAKREADEIVIKVKDTGVGIPPAKLPEMFKLFAQGERSIARSEGGLGIGLTIVQKLVEMHGGTVSALSEGPGQGSEFIVRLPVVEKPQPADLADEAGSRETKKGARILVVDDNVDTAIGMARLLQLLGNDITTAHDGPSAVAKAQSFRPEFILLDIGLPGMDGYEVAAAIRQDAGLKHTIIIGVSGYGQDDDRRRSRAAGFNHHLVKPVDFGQLTALLVRTQ
jgi:PAS domain S-box-containing protein